MITDPDQYRAKRVKTKAVTLPGGDEQEQIEIRALSAGGFQEIVAARDEDENAHTRHAYITCKWGVTMCRGMTVDDVADLFTVEDAVFLAGEIVEMSGMNEDPEKNSNSTPDSDSSTG